MKFLLLAVLAAASFAFAASPEAEVKAAIEEWKTAVIQKNVPVLQKLLHEQITYAHSSALTENKAQAIAAFTAPTMQYKAIDMSDTTYRTFGNTVLVKTNMTVKNAENGVDKSLGLSVLMVWIKDQGRWQLVARQSTRLP